MRVSDSGRVLQLIEDPVADKLRFGDTTFGWEGDQRLALYIDYALRTYELWRLEGDEVYRPTIRLSADTWRGPEVVGELITRLLASDQRRGVKVLDVVEKAAAKAEAERETKRTDAVEVLADKLEYAFTKDDLV